MMSLNNTMKREHQQVQKKEGKGKPLRQYLWALISNMGMFCIGLMNGWSSPIQSKLEDPEQTPLDGLISSTEMSWVASLLLVAGTFTPFVAAFTVDRFGRKRNMIACTIPVLAGCITLALANTVELLFLGRALQSSGIFIIFTSNLVYISEIATDDARGPITSLVHLSVVFGILVMFCIGPFTSYQAVGYTMTAFVALYFVMLWFIPESPNYYIIKGDNESAKKSLMIIRGKTEEQIESEYQKLKINFEAKMNEDKVKLSDLWLTKAHTMSVVIFFILIALQQLSGLTFVMYFMVFIFATAGSSIQPEIASIMVAAIQFLASLFVPFVVERFGRKVLLIISLAGVSVSLAVLGTYFKLLSINEAMVEDLGWIPLLTLVTTTVSYCVGIGPLTWTVGGEILPIKIKTLVTSIGTCLNFTLSFIVVLTFNPIQEAVGTHSVFWFCCGLGLFGLIFICKFLPETRKKTFQQIEELLSR